MPALGVMASYGVLSRASAIEVYAPALFLDVALVEYCLRSQLTRDRDAVAASLLLVLAVGLHVTNLLIIPGVIALAIGLTPKSRIARTLVSGRDDFSPGNGSDRFSALVGAGPGGVGRPTRRPSSPGAIRSRRSGWGAI